MKLMIVTDAWEPQVNGVVRTLKMTCREVEKLGHRVEILSPQGFRTLPCPSYPEIELALASRRAVAAHIDAFAPDWSERLVVTVATTLAIVIVGTIAALMGMA